MNFTVPEEGEVRDRKKRKKGKERTRRGKGR